MTEKSTSSPQGTSSFSLFYSRLNGVTGHLRPRNLAEAVPPPGVLRESAFDATPSSSPHSAEVADGGLPRGFYANAASAAARSKPSDLVQMQCSACSAKLTHHAEAGRWVFAYCGYIYFKKA